MSSDAPTPIRAESSFQQELERLINRHSCESEGGDTPNFILAKFLTDMLRVFGYTVRRREDWFGRGPKLAEVEASAVIPPRAQRYEMLESVFKLAEEKLAAEKGNPDKWRYWNGYREGAAAMVVALNHDEGIRPSTPLPASPHEEPTR